MSTLQQVFPFTQQYVDAAPDQHGVYLLYEFGQLTYIGQASGMFVSIRSSLQSHLRGDEGLCTFRATQFACHVSFYPKMLEEQLLREYAAATGRLPRCNDRIG